MVLEVGDEIYVYCCCGYSLFPCPIAIVHEEPRTLLDITANKKSGMDMLKVKAVALLNLFPKFVLAVQEVPIPSAHGVAHVCTDPKRDKNVLLFLLLSLKGLK